VQSLAEEFDVLDVAAAAAALAAQATGNLDEEAEIPTPSPPPKRAPDERKTAHGAKTPFAAKPERSGTKKDKRAPDGEIARLWIGLGRVAGVRPADLVGAIANEAGVPSRVIGAIQVSERYSVVEVPESLATGIIAALRATTIKGRKVTVRRDRAA
jgi:ATP-dependent RNA helicase DeaD